MSKYVLSCSCHGMGKRIPEAFSVLFPGQPLPTIIKGRDRIYQFALNKHNDHLFAISKLSGKFAYYVEMDGDNILEEYNLLTGRRIA